MTKFVITSFFILFLFYQSSLFAFETACKFEEVYDNGQAEQGFMLLKDKKLRYQYYDNQLFTIFFKNNDFYLVKNNQTKFFQKIQDNTEVIKELINLAALFPDIKDNYQSNDLKISIEKSKEHHFIKRISVNSKDMNMSIYFFDCQNQMPHSRFFNFSPYFPYEF